MNMFHEAVTPTRRYLSAYTAGNDNNFNLVRFLAATLVLITHSFALSTGLANSEPLRETLGITWGSIAVDIFFVASGFLVTGSLLYRQNLKEFLVARALRILPALWVSLVLTVLAIGLFFTTFDFLPFLLNIQTVKFLVKNSVLVFDLVWVLPGAFQGVPGNSAVNGSLWSLPAEIKMYLLLASLWLVFSLLRFRNKAWWLSRVCVLLAVVGLVLCLIFYRVGTQSGLIYLGTMFFSGAALRALQDRVVVSTTLGVGLLAALFVSAAVDRSVFEVLYRLTLPYVVLYLAVVPRGQVRRFNMLGDYSYGLYIYAFPIQKALVYCWPGINPYEMMVSSFAVTLVFAVASWHLIEKRALMLKGKYA